VFGDGGRRYNTFSSFHRVRPRCVYTSLFRRFIYFYTFHSSFFSFYKNCKTIHPLSSSPGSFPGHEPPPPLPSPPPPPYVFHFIWRDFYIPGKIREDFPRSCAPRARARAPTPIPTPSPSAVPNHVPDDNLREPTRPKAEG